MGQRFDCTVPADREAGLFSAAAACRRGDLVVLPTETLYGLCTDAFSASGTDRLRAVLGRPRSTPLPVLIGRPQTAEGLVLSLGADGRALAEAFWPGPLTLVAPSQPSLRWNVGEPGGAVSVRMPIHPVALELLRETGPLVVTGANPGGSEPPRTADDAIAALGGQATVILDAGACQPGPASTVVDLTGAEPRLLRAGALSLETLREVVPGLRSDGP